MTDTGMLVVNRLGVESYLRGVVPLEIGNRQAGEEAAVQAQAVAARSYSYVHMAEAPANRGFDMYATVQDQVYGGADVEKPMPTLRSPRPRTWSSVTRKIINTPYHSTCGGQYRLP